MFIEYNLYSKDSKRCVVHDLLNIDIKKPKTKQSNMTNPVKHATSRLLWHVKCRATSIVSRNVQLGSRAAEAKAPWTKLNECTCPAAAAAAAITSLYKFKSSILSAAANMSAPGHFCF
jgi:hypothetical protein